MVYSGVEYVQRGRIIQYEAHRREIQRLEAEDAFYRALGYELEQRPCVSPSMVSRSAVRGVVDRLGLVDILGNGD